MPRQITIYQNYKILIDVNYAYHICPIENSSSFQVIYTSSKKIL